MSFGGGGGSGGKLSTDSDVALSNVAQGDILEYGSLGKWENKANNAYVKPAGGIPETDLDSATQTKLNSGGSGTKTLRQGLNIICAGDVVVPDGQWDNLPAVFVPAATGQTVKLVAAKHVIGSGTSATVSLQKNGTDITGWTGIGVTTAATAFDGPDVTLADGDTLQLVVTAVSGGPQNLTFTLFLEHTV